MMMALQDLRTFHKGELVDMIDLSVYGPLQVPMPQRWYLLRVHPNHESKVMKWFRRLNISGHMPTLTSKQDFTRYRRGYEWIDRRNVVSPLITGAILIPDFEVVAPRWRGIEGVIGIYHMGECAPYLTPQLFTDLCNIEAIGNTPKSKRDRLFAIGELVRVVSGPFRDFCARVERFDSTGRLSIGVEIFGRITPIEVSESDIEAVSATQVAARLKREVRHSRRRS